MTRFIKSIKDNQELYFHTFLDCLIYFEAVESSDDSKYQTYYSAFRRSGHWQLWRTPILLK